MKKILENITVIALAISYFIYSGMVNVNYYFSIAFLFFMFIYFIMKNRGKIEKERWKNYKVLLIPVILLILYELGMIVYLNFFSSGISNLFMKKALARILLFVSTSLGSIAIYDIFEKKSVDILYKSVVLNYSFYIIIAIISSGFGGIFKYLYSNFLGEPSTSILEAHEVTFSISLILLYYYFNKEHNKKRIIILTIIFILGFKRIAIVGVLCFMLLYKIIKNFKSKKMIKFIIISGEVAFLMISFIWLNLVKTDGFDKIGKKYNIDFMGRTHLYSLIKNEFELSPTYIGQGLGYVNYWQELHKYQTNDYALHSGIIEMYIDLGFIIYIVFTAYKLMFNSIAVLKQNKENSIKYFLISFFVLILWTTDNVATYLNFLVVENILLMNLLARKNNNIVLR